LKLLLLTLAKQKLAGSDSDKIKQIASISANNDEIIGELIISFRQSWKERRYYC
jgi:chaperonin GroEL